MIYPRKLTAAQWAEENITLRADETGIEKDTKKSKVGDGLTPWNKLSYVFDRHSADARYATKTEVTNLSKNYAYIQLAKNPDTLIAGAVTVNASDQVTSASVQWPDGSPGTLTITSRDSLGGVLAYNITYGSPVTKTFTQPTITRNANGAATNVPQIVVS